VYTPFKYVPNVAALPNIKISVCHVVSESEKLENVSTAKSHSFRKISVNWLARNVAGFLVHAPIVEVMWYVSNMPATTLLLQKISNGFAPNHIKGRGCINSVLIKKDVITEVN